MLGYALRRVLSAIPVAIITITACFFILRLAPGGPFDGERALPPDTLANLRAYYNLDQPLINQYFIYVWRLLQGDLGPSMVYNDFTGQRDAGDRPAVHPDARLFRLHRRDRGRPRRRRASPRSTRTSGPTTSSSCWSSSGS